MTCGRAIPNLYEFFAMKEGIKLETVPKGKEVFSKISSDPISRKAFNHFLRCFGTTLAHLAAAMLPDEGIFLCGAILGATLEHIKEDVAKGEESIFLKAFTNSPCVGSYLKTVPLYFTPEHDLGLKGCWNFLQLLAKKAKASK